MLDTIKIQLQKLGYCTAVPSYVGSAGLLKALNSFLNNFNGANRYIGCCLLLYWRFGATGCSLKPKDAPLC